MAKPLEPCAIGIDVSKTTLSVTGDLQAPVFTLDNNRTTLRRWLNTLPKGSRIALEATGTYHRVLARLAHQLGHQVFLIDGFKLSRYRDSLGGRAKTDACDARLILRYLRHEGDQLTPWTPPPAAYERAQALLRRRAALVQARVALTQSLRELPELNTVARSLDRRLRQLDALLTRRIADCLKEDGTWGEVRRCQAIEGVGPLTAMALANVFRRGDFRSSDAFIAYLGLDVRVQDSGSHRGRRKLTKKGDPELRRLLHNAAMAACRTPRWQPLYQSYLARGLETTQALVILARKLARIAFALMKSQTLYNNRACPAT